MNEKIKFSIIIPAYNSKKYIKKCLNSVIKQTYTNYEAIVIDDGSSDGTEKILDKFSEKYSKIKVIHQDNHGVSLSRKRAINSATGDYVAFLDSDDWYSPDLLMQLYKTLINNDYSIVQFGYYVTRFGLKKIINNDNQIRTIDLSLIKGFLNGYDLIGYSVCNKIYKTELIKKAVNNSSDILCYGEDAYLNLLVLHQNLNNQICIIDLPLYYYRQGSGVTSSNDKIKVFNETMKLKKEFYIYLKENIDNSSMLKSIFIDTAFITKYYSYLITENITDTAKCIELISDVVFNNPTISEFISIYSNLNFDVPECSELLKNNAEQYYNYVCSCKDELSKLTPTQKILKLIDKLKVR